MPIPWRHAALALTVLGLALAMAPRAAAAQWQTQKLAQANGGFLGVSCTSPSFCMAVGSIQGAKRGVALAEAYDGARWAVVPTPDVGGARDDELLGVSCSSPAACMAVGFSRGRRGLTHPLTERWDGSAWAIQPTHYVLRGGLASVSCSSPTACTAVGGSGAFPSAIGAALAERWVGGQWTIERVPKVRHALGEALRGVSCPTATACTAVGEEFDRSSGNSDALVVSWNGHRWATRLTVGEEQENYLFSAVSCRFARDCVAVGEIDIGISASYGLWARSGKRGWSTPRSNIVSDNQDLNGLACTTLRSCVAVGGVQEAQAYAETWNGSSWIFDPILSSLNARLDSVACPSQNRCVAVGVVSRGTRPPHPLVAVTG